MRKGRVVFVVAVALAMGALGAVAQSGAQASDAAKAPPAATKEALPQGGQAAAMGAGLVVFIDPATGKFRQPEPGEMEALVGSRQVKPLEVRPLEFRSAPSGAVGVVLDPSFDSYMVVTRQPDGNLTTQCIEGDAKANAAAATGAGAPSRAKAAQAPQNAGGKEASDVK